MTPEYRARREQKHAAEKTIRAMIAVGGTPTGTIDLTPKAPRLSWLAGKLFKSSMGGFKTRSRYSQEQYQANRDNRNPYKGEDGRWYYYDETEQSCETGFITREQAEIALNDYAAWLNGPKELIAEPIPVSIGGVLENEGLPAGESL